MKTPFAMARSLLSIVFLAAFSTAVYGQSQLSDALPVTMGLWQTETTSTVTGIENTPMAGMAAAMGRSHITQSCLTPEGWKSDIQGINERQQHGCTLSNVHQDSHEISFDQVCQGGRSGTNNSHVDILIDGAGHAHGTVITKVVDPAFPQPITIHVSMVSHYVSPACGDVKPGEGKMVK